MSTELVESTCTVESSDIDMAQITLVVDNKNDQKCLSYSYTSSDIHNSFRDVLYSSITDELKLSIKALKNLFKKYDFLQLNYQLETNQISVDEFNDEITKNENKYFIDQPNKKPSYKQLQTIGLILQEIERDKELSIDDVQDLFEVELDKYLAELNIIERE